MTINLDQYVLLCMMLLIISNTVRCFQIKRQPFKRWSAGNRALAMAKDTIIDVSSNFEHDCSLIRDYEVSLDDYMQLPVEQYVCIKMPLDATLERMHTTVFNLTVPPVKFFHLEVSPMLVCEVTQDENSVVIKSKYVELFFSCVPITSIFCSFNFFKSSLFRSIR